MPVRKNREFMRMAFSSPGYSSAAPLFCLRSAEVGVEAKKSYFHCIL
jgi:hypothetical protein